MSLLAWLFGKKPPRALPDSSGLQHMDHTRPLHPRPGHTPPPKDKPRSEAPAHEAQTPQRKSERHGRRELLYGVVRDTMARVGVLSSRYKFKVLSLDQHGRQFLVMMDISPDVTSDNMRLSEIEVLLAQTARARHQILVTAVYWRLNNHVSTGLSPERRAAVAQAVHAPVPLAPQASEVSHAAPRFEPIQSDEVAAFHKALAEIGAAQPTVGQTLQSGPRMPAQPTGFEDTERIPGHDPEDSRPQALSNTQYGDL